MIKFIKKYIFFFLMFFYTLSINMNLYGNDIIANIEIYPDQTLNQIPENFIGISIDYESIPYFNGNAETGINQIFIRLLSNMGIYGNGAGVLRISKGADISWWNPSGVKKPKGIYYDINYDWVTAMTEVARQSSVKFILGTNFAMHDVKLSKDWIFASGKLFPKNSILAFEIGESPDKYSNNYYSTQDLKTINIKSSDWNFEKYNIEYSNFVKSLKNSIQIKTELAGPGFSESDWLQKLNEFITENKNDINIITQKYYYFNKPFTVKELLSEQRLKSEIEKIKNYVSEAKDAGLNYRLTEFNLSENEYSKLNNSFYTSLWMTDILFEFFNLGISGVNIHNKKFDRINLYNFFWKENKTVANINPAHYGVVLFSEATQNKSNLIKCETETNINLKCWATKDSTGVIRVVLINKDEIAGGFVNLKIKNSEIPGELVRLNTDSYTDSIGVRLSGKTFDATNDGILTGTYVFERIIPFEQTYRFEIPKLSALMLILKP